MPAMTTQERIGRIFAVGGAVFVVLGLVCFAAGGRFNSTRSIPLGLYWVTDAPVVRART